MFFGWDTWGGTSRDDPNKIGRLKGFNHEKRWKIQDLGSKNDENC
jgi:hypothetical protein